MFSWEGQRKGCTAIDKEKGAIFSLAMVDQNLQKISLYILRQIAIIRQMVYNTFDMFDVVRSFLWDGR